jgi:hypothetical protein
MSPEHEPVKQKHVMKMSNYKYTHMAVDWFSNIKSQNIHFIVFTGRILK